MRYWSTFMIFIFSSFTFAEVVQVSIDAKKYEVDVTKEFISFNETGFSKRVKRQKCNRVLADQFVDDLNESETKLMDLDKSDIPKGAVQVSFAGKNKMAFRFGTEGSYFSDLPSKFKNLWLTSERICK